MRWLVVVAVACAFLHHTERPVIAQDEQAAPEMVTIVHYPKSGSAVGISRQLGKMVGPDTVIAEMVEQNVILIRVPVDQQDKVSNLIQAVDIPRPVLRYRVTWIETKNGLSDEQRAGLSGREADVKKVIDQLVSKGEIVQQSEYQTSSLSNTECVINRSERQAVVTGVTNSPRGATRSMKDVETGTIVQLRGLAAQSNILIDVSINRSIPGQADADGEPGGQGAQSIQVQSTLQIEDGNAQLVSSMLDDADDSRQNTYIILGVASE